MTSLYLRGQQDQLSLFEEEKPVVAEPTREQIAAYYPPVSEIGIADDADGASTLALWLHGIKGDPRKHIEGFLSAARIRLPEHRERYEEIRTLKVHLTQAGWEDGPLLRASLVLKANHIRHELLMIRACENALGLSPVERNTECAQ